MAKLNVQLSCGCASADPRVGLERRGGMGISRGLPRSAPGKEPQERQREGGLRGRRKPGSRTRGKRKLPKGRDRGDGSVIGRRGRTSAGAAPQSGAICSPGTWQHLGTFFGFHNSEGAPGISTGWRPGMPLNSLQCTGRPSHKSYLVPNVNSAQAEKP